MSEGFALQALEEDLLDLLETFLGGIGRDFVAAVFVQVHHAAAAEAHDQPALAEVVDQRDLLGHAQRVIKRSLEHREADLDATGCHRECRGESRRVDVDTVAVEMMFREKDGVHAFGLSQPGLGDRLVDDLGIRRRIA